MMHLNVLHRTDAPHKYPTVRKQQDLVHRLGIKSTVFIQYAELFNDQAIADALQDEKEFGDEIGLGLHRLGGPELDALSHGNESIWLFPCERKLEILERILARYREVFGRNPVSVASYHLDSSSLNILRELSPDTEIVVGGCFEEGVRVYHGCNHSWYLFNEGMPWNPWWPSKTHSLRPAKNEADANGIIAVPHLMRDMSLAYEDRDDFWASHPPNVMRGWGNLGSYCPYDRNLIDQYRMQERWNGGYSYYNSFVSAGWLIYNKNIEVPPIVAWDLYTRFLENFVELRVQGALQDMTLAEYAQWFRAHRPIQREPEVYWAKEMLYGSGKHYIWFQDSSQRVLIDADQGGSIGDWRPYAAEAAVATGPDTPFREIGSYPYLIQSQFRTGFSNHHKDGSRTTLFVSDGKETIDLATCRTKCRSIERRDEKVIVTLKPATIRFSSGLEAQIESVFRFHLDGQTLVERKLISLSDPKATLRIKEYVKACHGLTEYAEDLHDVTLVIADGAVQEMPFEYLGRIVEKPKAAMVQARIRSLGVTMELKPALGLATSGEFREGYLFNPYFTLALDYTLELGRSVQSWISLRKTS